MTIYQTLDDLSIQYKKYSHKAVFNCEEANALGLDIAGVATKNLFLRDRKGNRHFLVIVTDDKTVDLKSLSQLLDIKGLSFASADRLEKHLSTQAGSVSILDILNDQQGAVELIIDQSVIESPSLQCHPYTNTETLDIPVPDVKKLLGHYQRSFSVVDL